MIRARVPLEYHAGPPDPNVSSRLTPEEWCVRSGSRAPSPLLHGSTSPSSLMAGRPPPPPPGARPRTALSRSPRSPVSRASLSTPAAAKEALRSASTYPPPAPRGPPLMRRQNPREGPPSAPRLQTGNSHAEVRSQQLHRCAADQRYAKGKSLQRFSPKPWTLQGSLFPPVKAQHWHGQLRHPVRSREPKHTTFQNKGTVLNNIARLIFLSTLKQF